MAKGLEIKKPPFAIDEKKPKARWLKPVFLADVEYRRKTRRGLLRHPSYNGLREHLMEKPKRRRAARKCAGRFRRQLGARHDED